MDAAHPLSAVLSAVTKASTRVEMLALSALPLSAIEALVAAALWTSPDKVRALSELVWEKTGGTPFYVGEFLSALARRELLRFDPEQGIWTWELETLRRQSVTDNVASLLAARLKTMGQRTLKVLAEAACLGTTFTLSSLSFASGTAPEQLAEELAPTIGAGFLLVEHPEEASSLAAGLTLETPVSFQHDRVQQMAYESIAEAERPAVHLRLGQRLRQGPEAEVEGRLFDVVRHLNAGAPLLASGAERLDLGALNLQAARKARASAAHEPARRLLDMALSLLPADSWQSAYELTLEVHLERAQTALALSLFDDILQTRDQVMRTARTPLDRARVLELVVKSFAIQGQTDDAIDTAIEALRALGVSLPKHPFPPALLVEFARIRMLRGARSLPELLNAPFVTEPAIQTALRILAALLISVTTARPLLKPLVMCTMLGLTFQHGSSPQAAAAYAMYGVLLGLMENFQDAVAFGTLSLDLLDRFPGETSRGWVMAIVVAAVHPFHRPLQECIRMLDRAALAAREAGELEGDGAATSAATLYSFLAGVPLESLQKRCGAALRHAEKNQHVLTRFLASVVLQSVESLMARPGSPEAQTRILARAELQRELERRQNTPMLAYFWGYQIIEHYLRGEFEEASACVSAYKKHRQGTWGMPSVSAIDRYVIDSYVILMKLGQYPELSLSERAAVRAKLIRFRLGLRKRVRFSPYNLAHLERLLTAEWSRVSGAARAVIKAQYQAAIELAHTHGFLHAEALAQELYARFLATRGDEALARAARQTAYRLYQSWGAEAVLARLEKSFPELHSQPVAPSSSSASVSVDNLQLDLTAVLRAAQALSGEIVLTKLLSALLTTLLEAAGAARGVLLLRDGAALVHAAEAKSGDKAVLLPPPLPLSQEAPLALSLIRYVERSREELILEHSLNDPRFATDPYLVRRTPCALLALPLVRQGVLTGVLYLENDVTSGAFTPARVQVVRLLASQAAISLENAKLYAAQQAYAQTLEQQVQARTLDLSQTLERLHTELADAASYIRSRLPSPLPDGGPVAADWLFVPSIELGGDAFDYFFVDDHRFVLYLLDVSGHGVGPSLLALTVMRSLREQGLPGVDLSDPSAVCKALNQRFPSDAYQSRYFTLFYAVMDLRTRTLRYVQAGHPPALLQSDTGHQFLSSEGAMIGLMEDLEYPAAQCQVEPGARLYVFSDGAYEVSDPERRMLPFEQFCAELLGDPPARIRRPQALERMLALARTHHRSQTLPDDFSFLAFDFPRPLD